MKLIDSKWLGEISGGGGNDFGQNAEKLKEAGWVIPTPPPPAPTGTSDGSFWGDYWYYLQNGNRSPNWLM